MQILKHATRLDCMEQKRPPCSPRRVGFLLGTSAEKVACFSGTPKSTLRLRG